MSIKWAANGSPFLKKVAVAEKDVGKLVSPQFKKVKCQHF